MDKIYDLANISYLVNKLPKEVEVEGNEINYDVMISRQILLPVIVMIANYSYYKLFGDQLIHFEGGVIKEDSAPFGVTLVGDINIEKLKHPIAIVLTVMVNSFLLIKKPLLDDNLDILAGHWGTFLNKYKDGESISFDEYVKFPLLSAKY